MSKPKTVSLFGNCPNCGEAVEMVITKKQIKAIMKGFKTGSPAEAELLAEIILGRNKKGGFKK